MELVLLFGSYAGVIIVAFTLWHMAIRPSGPKFKWTHFPVYEPWCRELLGGQAPFNPNLSDEEALMGCDWCERYVADGDGRYRGEAGEYRLCPICEITYDEGGR